MSDSKTMSSNPNKRRIQEIDGRIEDLSHEILSLNDLVSKTQMECSLLAVKLKREKVKALTALAKSKVLLADMEILVAESDLLIDLENLKNCKKMKLDRDAGKSQQESQETAKSNKSIAVQTDKSSSEKKKRKHRTSKPDTSSDETIIIPLLETSKTETHVAHFNFDLIKKSSANNSDSEASLSSSLKAEFEKPYKTDTPKPDKKTESEKPEKKSKGKSDKKNRSKSKSKSSQQTQSPNTSSSASKPKTVAELKAKTVEQINKSIANLSSHTNTSTHSIDRDATPSTSFIPIRHNMPQMVSQSHGIYLSRLPQSASHTGMQTPPLQTNFTYHEPRNMILQNHAFYRKSQ